MTTQRGARADRHHRARAGEGGRRPAPAHALCLGLCLTLGCVASGPQRAPEDPWTRARSARDQGKLAQAREIIAPEARSGELRAVMLLAEIDTLRGHHAAAADALAPTLKQHPDNPELLALYARALDGAGRGDKALAAWQRLLELRPAHRQGTERAAVLLMARRKPRQAQAILDAGLRANPKDAGLHALRAKALLARGRLPLALAAARRATRLDARSPLAWVQLARAQTLAGEIAEGVSAYERVLGLDPQHSAALAGLGALHLQQRRYGDAARVLERAAAVRPHSAAVWNILAVAQSRNGAHDDAVESINRALALAPRNGLLHRNHAEILLDAGRPADAVEVARALLAMKAPAPDAAARRDREALLARAVVLRSMQASICEGAIPAAGVVQARAQAALKDLGMGMTAAEIAAVAASSSEALKRMRARCVADRTAPNAGAHR